MQCEQLVLAAIGVALGLFVGGLVSTKLQPRIAEVLSAGGPRFPASTLVIATGVVEVFSSGVAVGLLAARGAARSEVAEMRRKE